MATYSRGVIVFGLGMLLVSLWCMKATEATTGDDEEVTIHAIRREEPEGCNSKHSDAGEECTDEDDVLGLYADVDDTFRAVKSNVASTFSHFQEGSSGDYDDSPDIAHNNVDVLGH